MEIRRNALSQIAGQELTSVKSGRNKREARKEMQETLEVIVGQADKVVKAHPDAAMETRLIKKIAGNSLAQVNKMDHSGWYYLQYMIGDLQAALEVISAVNGSLTPATITAAAGNVLAGQTFDPFSKKDNERDGELGDKNKHLLKRGLDNLQILNEEVKDKDFEAILREGKNPGTTLVLLSSLGQPTGKSFISWRNEDDSLRSNLNSRREERRHQNPRVAITA